MSEPIKPDMSRLKLLQVLEPSGGGSGRHFLDLCKALNGRGHDVTAVYSPLRAEPRFVEELQALGLANTLSVDMRRAVGPWDAKALLSIRRIITRNGPFDIVHGHSSKAGALTRLRLPGKHVPRVYTPHAFRTMDPTLGSKGRLVYGLVEGVLGRFLSDRIICVSGDEYNHGLSLGIRPETLRVVVNGVATPPQDRRQAMRARLGVPGNAFAFGFIGRLTPQKAPERLIAAFERIATRFPLAHLVIIGFGELDATIRAMIASAGLSERVTMSADIAGSEAIQTFDALVTPSRYEAMSYVMLEAAAAGKPLILSDVGGAGTVLEHGVNGCLVPNTDDPAPLAEAILSFADPDVRRRLEAGALARQNRYGLDKMVEETLQVYQDLLSERPLTIATAKGTGSDVADGLAFR
ncbi:glycosyltransferase family 4 protein [Rhizobium sp. CG5]|uniref:glycosyltransferase n=1 Tax=Rhizobium sp. CG5 TaxID=2726076 RepID=UPI002033A1D9|nr:glycosyltransferase [Rhizobium sp. CG5]MCM2473880.1 glycosyltransferase family 4 protein [Rhizobium sp. CG5]